MKNKRQWYTHPLVLVLGVALIAGVVVFAPKGVIFQGNLNNPSYSECQTYKQWADAGTLTAHLGSDLTKPIYCSNAFPTLWGSSPSLTLCKTLLSYGDTATLSSMISSGQIQGEDVAACANTYHDLWYGPNETQCKLYKVYMMQGIYSSMVADGSLAGKCATNYPEVWENYPSLQLCKTLKGYGDAATLSSMINSGNVSGADVSACAIAFHDFWYAPSEAQCKIYKEYMLQGTYSSIVTDGSLAYQCATNYPEMWDKYPSANDCKTLKGYTDPSVLSSLIAQGKASAGEAIYCSYTYPDLWNGPSYQQCKLYKSYKDAGTLTAMLGANLLSGVKCSNIYPELWDAPPAPTPPKPAPPAPVHPTPTPPAPVHPTPTPTPKPNACDWFSDVSKTDPLYPAIKYVKDAQIFSGYADCTFRPTDTINRAEATKVVLLGFGKKIVSNKNVYFSDVFSSDWFYNYVASGKYYGILSGYPDGTFKPQKQVNRAELLKIFITGSKLKSELYTVKVQDSTCSDLGPGHVSDWYMPYFQIAVDNGLISVDACNPAQGMTRGDVAQLFYLYDKI